MHRINQMLIDKVQRYGAWMQRHRAKGRNWAGLISSRIGWFELLAVKGTLESSAALQFKSINSSVFSFLYGPTLTPIHDYWKNHSFDYTDQNDTLSS